MTYVPIYLAIGAVIGMNRIARGIQGSVGPIVTFLAWTALWPAILLYERVQGVK
jgi:hypothetical protein